MSFTLARRTLIGSGLALALPAAVRGKSPDLEAAAARLAAIEARIGGRMGVAVLDSGRGVRLKHRGGELFPMCSTFKFLAAAAALSQVDA